MLSQISAVAVWPVWRDSVRGAVKFAPLSKKEAARRWHKARRHDLATHERGKHGGALGRPALAVLRALLFEFLDYASGRLDPSYDAIVRKSGYCRRTVAKALARLRDLGFLHWQRRCVEDKDELGRFQLRQLTNAYAVLSPSHWRGYWEPPPPPLPEPGTWGDHPPLPDVLEQYVAETTRGQHRAALALLKADPGDQLAGALARFGRAVLERP